MTTATISFLSVATPNQYSVSLRGCNGQILSLPKSSSSVSRRISLYSPCSSTSCSNPVIVEQESLSPPPSESTTTQDPDALPPIRDIRFPFGTRVEGKTNPRSEIETKMEVGYKFGNQRQGQHYPLPIRSVVIPSFVAPTSLCVKKIHKLTRFKQFEECSNPGSIIRAVWF